MKTNLLQKNIPKGWEIKKIKDLLDFEQPTKYIVESSSYTPDGRVPVLTANKSFVLGYTTETDGVYTNTPAIIFDDFTTDSKYVDFPFKIKSSAIKILTNRDENTDLKFVYEIMKSFTFPIANHKRHYISQYQELDIVVPLITEQQKIAQILSTIDGEIQKVDEIIVVTEKLKNGLMQNFFSHKSKFNTTLEDIGAFKRGPFGGSLKKEIFVKHGYKVYEQKNAIYNNFTLGSYFIDEEKFEQMKGFAIKHGDIIVSCSGTLGKVAVVPTDFQEGIINQALLRITPSKEWDVSYVKYLLDSEYVQGRFVKVAPGSAMKNMASIQTIKATKVTRPPLIEQQKISKILSSIDSKISMALSLKKKISTLKKGLVQDLLSGKVRTI